MNITTYSPALALLYVIALLWILMGVDAKSFSRRECWVIPLVILLLCVANDVLRKLVGPAVYGRSLFFCVHLPTFFLFLYIAKRGVIKTIFMILTALVFITPTVLIGNVMRRFLCVDSPLALLMVNLISYLVMLLFAWFVFREVFHYLLTHGDSRFFLLFSLVPIVYYIYLLAAVNQDFSSLSSFGGYVVCLIPVVEAFAFYFLLPYLYKSIREKMTMQSTQGTLQQKLASAEEQLALLNEANEQMAVYRHDVRHQLNLLNGLLLSDNTEQAKELIQTVMDDLDRITPKRFCENETVNLICSSYVGKAQRLGVQLKVNALLPKQLPLSDTELCSVVSNGLENALRAAAQTEVVDKWIRFDCHIKQKKLFLQIQNPYVGQVVMRSGLPVSAQEGHGYGCHSIQAVAQRNDGLCSFKAEKGVFTLRVSISLPD